jgi:hypothetical protein
MQHFLASAQTTIQKKEKRGQAPLFIPKEKIVALNSAIIHQIEFPS